MQASPLYFDKFPSCYGMQQVSGGRLYVYNVQQQQEIVDVNDTEMQCIEGQ
jgi:hypothetical protein